MKGRPAMTKHRSIGVIGAGHVGSHVAAALVTGGVCRDLILIDTDGPKAEAQAADLRDLAALCPRRVDVRAGGYGDLRDAGLVFISASGPIFQEDRLEELDTSLDTMDEIIPQLSGCGFGGILAAITNPVDLVALYLHKKLGWPRRRILGSGTLLDSARLRGAVARRLDTAPASVAGYVLGEHGDSQLAAWSTVTVGGIPLDRCAPPDFPRQDITRRVRTAGWDIVLGKGSTEFGIGTAAARLARAILEDQGEILPVSALLEGEYGRRGLCAGVPCRLGTGGVEEILPLDLPAEEAARFGASCDALEAAIQRKGDRFQ